MPFGCTCTSSYALQHYINIEDLAGVSCFIEFIKRVGEKR